MQRQSVYVGGMDVSVTELRANLAAFLGMVEQGEEVTVTDRGVPIAQIVPAGLAARLRQLEADGIISMPTRPERRPLSGHRFPKVRGGSINDLRDEWR